MAVAARYRESLVFVRRPHGVVCIKRHLETREAFACGEGPTSMGSVSAPEPSELTGRFFTIDNLKLHDDKLSDAEEAERRGFYRAVKCC